MEYDILVYNNFFGKEIQNDIWERMMRPKWSLTGGNKYNRFWHMDGLEIEEYFNEYLYRIICKKLDREFSGVGRIYANGQTAGQWGNPHVDDGDMTFLYFANPEWDISLMGNFMMINRGLDREKGERFECNPDEDEIVKIVTFKSDRAVLFPGNIVHFAEAPHGKFFNGLRVSLAYKLYI
tara:strand:- start:75 stop:614 length:540 start_codon:yes stop_codon:yes gene_type:complete